nr:unnamed protein product [Callosobruchus chinensis]
MFISRIFLLLLVPSSSLRANEFKQLLNNDLNMDSKLASFQKEAMFNISRYQLNSITDINIHRECQLYLQLAKICDYNNPRKCDLLLQPDIEDIFSESSSEAELACTWIERSNAVGPKCRNLFQDLREYTDSCIKEKLKHYNRRIRPLYEQLHAYVRFKLRKKYGNCISETGLLPAHLLGDVSAQKWGGVGIATLPYAEAFEDLSENLKRQNYTLTDIARFAEDFQKSLNLTKMPDAFWKKSIFTKSKFRSTYVALSWKWKVLSGKITPEHYNSRWWKLVEKYQGLKPPVSRSEKHFDPGNIYEIICGDSILKNFTALILQFQIFKELCEKARQFQIFDKPNHLHSCDIYHSSDAGKALRTMMLYGRARPWTGVVKYFLSYGQLSDELNPDAILEYFQPLYDWLKQENERNGVYVGWTTSNTDKKHHNT